MALRFLIAAVIGLAIVINARRALRFSLVVVPAFFASWLTIELAPQLLLATFAGAAYFAARGALDDWPGWIALAISFLNGFLLWGIISQSLEVKDIFASAFEKVLGPERAAEKLSLRNYAFPFKLWSRQIHRRRDIPYVAGGRRRLRLDIWKDKEDSTGRPCLLYVPGGAWMVGISNKNQQGKPLLIELATRGWLCFSMNYPVSPRAKFPAHIVAVKRAIAWIREHAHEYGGDPNFVMITGNSAGGHLSSLAALTPNDPDYQPDFEDADTTIQAAAPLYGVYDMTGAQLEELPRSTRRHKKGALQHMERLVVGQRLKNAMHVFEKGSPWHRVGPHAPPFFVIHGDMDTLALVEEARGFVSRLKSASNEPVIYAELPGAQHAFDQFISIRTLYTVRAIARFGEWAYERWKANVDRPERQTVPSPRDPT